MPELSRSQLVVYGAVAVALLLVGARAIRAEGGEVSPLAAVAAVEAGGAEKGGIAIGGGGGDLVVDVTGAVRDPGVYRLPNGARVVDAIERAGGAAGGAALDGVNRAARLVDGQQVVVPSRSGGGSAVSTATGGSAGDGPISLGAATVEQLDTIEGIGPVTAEKIVEFRERRGGLASVEQLDEVSGIGPATMEALRSRLQP